MEIVTKESLSIVGFKITCREFELSSEIPKLWKEFKFRARDIKHRKNRNILYVCLGKNGDEYTQLVCAEVSQFQDVPEGMTGIIIPPQRYVYYKHGDGSQDIWKSFHEMSVWAKVRGYIIDPGDFKIEYHSSEEKDGYELYYKVL
jgi:predicted transcriptional regulator YdeE